MDQVGQYLRAAREAKGVSMKEVSMETNMGMKYLSAIEENRFKVFPSDTHVIGFIRNYARFLDIEPEPLIDIYKRMLLQDTPAPLEELTAPTKGGINPNFFVGLFVILSVIGLLVVLVARNGGGDVAATPADGEGTPTETTETPEAVRTVTRSFVAGEHYLFTVDKSEKRISFVSISNQAVTFRLMDTGYSLAVREKRLWDFNGDGFSDLRVTVDEVRNERAVVTISQVPERIAQDSDPAVTPAVETPVTPAVETPAGRSLITSQEPVEISLLVKASGLSTVSVVKDDQQRESRTLKEGEQAAFRANTSLAFTANNPQNLALQLNNIEFTISGRGVVAGFLFKWRKNMADGLFHLEYERLQ